MSLPEHSSRCVHVVCDEVGGGSANHHSLHLVSTGLNQVRQVVLLGNITSRVDLHNTITAEYTIIEKT